MAVKQALLRSNISITKIQKSVSSLGKGLNQAKESSSKMRLSLMDRNRFKRRQLQFEDNNFHRRRQAVKRKNAEDSAEVSNIGGARRFAGNLGGVIGKSSRGIFGRIVDTIGVLLVGWLINNLPTIIKGVQGLISRIQKVVSIASGFIRAIGNFASSVSQIFSWGIGFISGKNKELVGKEAEAKAANMSAKTALGGIDQEIDNATRMSNNFSLDGSGPSGGGGGGEQTSGGGFNPKDHPWMFGEQEVKESFQQEEEQQQEEEKKPQGFMRGLLGFADAVTGDTWNLDKQEQTSNETKEEDKPKGFMRGLAGFGDLVTGNAFDFDKQNKPPSEAVTAEPQQTLINTSGLLPQSQESQVGEMATGEDLDAVNQEREMFNQEPLTNETENKKEGNRGFLGWRSSLDWMTGGRTDMDGMGNTPDQIQPNPIQPTTEVSSITQERKGKVIYIQKSVSPTSSGGGGGGGTTTSTKTIVVNSSRELARRITLNNLQYT